MLVDDELVLLSALARIIGSSGYEVVTVTSGNRALAALADPGSAPPDLIITDVLMDDGDGVHLFSTVRADPALMHTPFIFVSASTKPDLERQIANSPNAIFMSKPFDVELLLARIADVLARAAG